MRGTLAVRLTPCGEEVVAYDAEPDLLFDPKPHILIVCGAEAKKDFEISAGEGTLINLRKVQLTPSRFAVAATYSSAGDHTGSYFLLIGADHGTYKIEFQKAAAQGRMCVFPGANPRIQVWSSLGDGECVWCAQHYQIAEYEWRNGAFAQIKTHRPKRKFDPNAIQAEPVHLKRRISPEADRSDNRNCFPLIASAAA